MRLGLVTDVHNHAPELEAALRIFEDHDVDRILTLGDTIDAFNRDDGAEKVARMLSEREVIGVWGNHDFALCREVEDRHREAYSPHVLDVMSQMQPRLVMGECHFSHRESSADPHDVAQLWNLSGGVRDMTERAGWAFGAVEHRWQFTGHYHRWWATTPDGPVDWDGGSPLHLDPNERMFVVIAAMCEGWCAVLDTETGRLDPLRCAGTATG